MLPGPSGSLSPPPPVPVSAAPPPRRPSSLRRFFARLYGPATPAAAPDAASDASDAAPARVTSAQSLPLPPPPPPPPAAFLPLPPPHAASDPGMPPPVPPLDAAHFPAGSSAFPVPCMPPHAASTPGMPPPVPPLDAAHFPAGSSAFRMPPYENFLGMKRLVDLPKTIYFKLLGLMTKPESNASTGRNPDVFGSDTEKLSKSKLNIVSDHPISRTHKRRCIKRTWQINTEELINNMEQHIILTQKLYEIQIATIRKQINALRSCEEMFDDTTSEDEDTNSTWNMLQQSSADAIVGEASNAHRMMTNKLVDELMMDDSSESSVEAAPAKETAPAEEAAPSEDAAPAEEAEPAREAAPAEEEGSPAEEPPPEKEAPPAVPEGDEPPVE